jgi:hypothetical protein
MSDLAAERDAARARMQAAFLKAKSAGDPQQAVAGDGAGNLEVPGRTGFIYARLGSATGSVVEVRADLFFPAINDTILVAPDRAWGLGTLHVIGFLKSASGSQNPFLDRFDWTIGHSHQRRTPGPQDGPELFDVYTLSGDDNPGTSVTGHVLLQGGRSIDISGAGNRIVISSESDVYQLSTSGSPGVSITGDVLLEGGPNVDITGAGHKITIGASGVLDFTDLKDVPASYTAQAGKLVKVKTTEDGLEFAAPGAGTGDVVGPAGATDGHLAVFDGSTGKAIKDGGAIGVGHTIQDEGTPLTQRANLNFVGAGVTVTDDSVHDASVVTIPGGGGGSASPAVGAGALVYAYKTFR